MGNLQESNYQNQFPLNININNQNLNSNLINNQQLNQVEINIDIISKDKVIVKIPTSNNIIWQKEYFNNDLIGTVINDYIIENNIQNSVEFLNNLAFEGRELNLQDNIDSLLNTHNKSLNDSEKDKYIELIAKPFSDPFEIYCFSKNNKKFKIIRYTNELKENKKIKNFSSSSAYCNGFDHLYISGGENSRNFFWEINLQTNIINDPIQIPPKQNHSMIYIPKYMVFIVGGNDLNTFYYNINKKRILNWGKLNIKRIEPALQVIQNKLYCIDSSNSFNDKNNYTIEVTDINSNEGKWSIIRPILPLNMVFSQQLFGVSKDKDNNIIFLGGSLNKNGTDMNFMYSINDNAIDYSNVKYLSFNLKEKTFIQINRTYECILPDFDRNSPQIVFYNKKNGKTELIDFSPNINDSKIFEVISPLKIKDNNNSINGFNDNSFSYATFKNKTLKDNSNNLYNIYGSGINKNNNKSIRVKGVSPNVSFWNNDKNNMSNASKKNSLLNSYREYNKNIISNNSSFLGSKANIISTISPNSSFIKNNRSSNSPSFSSSKNKIVKGVPPNLSFCEGKANNNNNKYEINLKRSRFFKIPIINNNKSFDNSDINSSKRKKYNNNSKVCGVSPNLSFWEGDSNNLNNRSERISKMPILKNNSIIDNSDINNVKRKKNNNGKVYGVSPNLSFWENDSSNNNNNYKINLKRSKISITNNNSTNDNSEINSVKRKENNNSKVYGVSPNLSFWESCSNNNKKNEINLKKSKYSKMSITNNNKSFDNNDINSEKRKNNNRGNVSGVSPNLSFWEYNSNNNNKKYVKRNETFKIPNINNNKNICNSQIDSAKMKNNNKGNVYGVSPNLSFWEGDSSNNNNLYENNLNRSRTSKILIINNNDNIYNSQINNVKRNNNNKSNVFGVSPNLSFWENSSKNLNRSEIISPKRNPNQISIINNIEDNNNGITINSQKINKNNGISPSLSFWSNSPKNININGIIPLKPKQNLSIKNNIEDNNNSNNNNNSSINKGRNINTITGVSPNLSFWESKRNNNINIGNDNDKPILNKNDFNENNKVINNNTQIKNNVKMTNNKYKSSYINGVFPKVDFWADDKDKDINLNKSFNNIKKGDYNANQIYGQNKKNNYDKK